MRMPPDSPSTDNNLSASGRVRPRGNRWPRRALALVTLVVIVTLTALCVVRFLQIRGLTMYKSSNLSVSFPAALPPYQFIWRANAPGGWNAEQAFASEGRVLRTSDGAELSPVAALWVAQSADAALVIAQLDASGHWLAVVPLIHSGSGRYAIWRASAGTWPPSQHCSGTSASPTGMCAESKVHSPDGPLPELWEWSAADGTVGVAVHFAGRLLAPANGGSLAELRLVVGQAALPDGSMVVAVGTAAPAVMQRQAEQLAAAA